MSPWFPRIPLRWKLLILLLATALGPLSIVCVLHFRGTLELGTSLAAQTREREIRQMQQHVLQWISDKAAAVRQRRHLLEMTLRAQARDVERCLVAAPPGVPRIVYTEEIDRSRSPLPGFVLSPKHRCYDEATAAYMPIAVNWSEQAFHHPATVPRQAVAADAARLAGMSNAYRFLFKNDPDLIFWQYTALESGLSCAYPGHGGEPAGFDPRQRPWYRRTKERGKLTWYGPYIDASSRALVLTLSMPVHRPDGAFGGVTAIDLHLDDLAANLKLPDGWPADALSMMVALDSQDGRPGLRVLSRPGYSSKTGNWEQPFETYRLESADAAAFGRMLQQMQQGLSGMEQMPWEGRDCLWGYGTVQEKDLFLVVILPYREIIAGADAAQHKAIEHTRQQVRQAQLLFVLIILIVSLIAFVGSRAVTQPIHQLALAAQGVAKGNFDTRVEIRTRDEMEELGAAFNRMVPQLRDRLRLKQSLDLAREVQQHLLPAGVPKIPGLDVAGQSLYCDETGGDYYDYLESSRNGHRQLGLVVGDITGHGIAAAMLMATARSRLHAQTEGALSLAELFTQLNRQLAADVTGGRFMTLFHLLIDPVERVATWVSAGHDPALCYRAVTDSFHELAGDGLPLGIDASQGYAAHGGFALQSGDVIVMGTDGIWEAANPQGERFGKDLLRQTIRQNAAQSAAEVLQSIMRAVTHFRQTAPQQDDITAVVVKMVPAA